MNLLAATWRWRAAHAITTGVAVLAILAAGWLLRRSALSPAEVAARDAAPSGIDWNTVTDDPGERLAIRWLGGARGGGSDGSWVQRQIEARFNVELVPVVLDARGYNTRKPLMFAGGDVADVIVEMDPIMLQRDAFHGFLLDVPYEVLRKYAPRYINEINTQAPVAWLYAYCGGRNYGLPTWWQGDWAWPGVWRADWLEKVGIAKIPETLDEMHEAFRRFTFNDPDGNGIRDTYGFSGDGQAWWFASFTDIFGAYGVIPYDWMERDGKLVWGGLLPEARQALALLRQWYAEGLLDPEFVTDSYGNKGLDGKLLHGVIGYCAGYAGWHNFDPNQSNAIVNRMRAINPVARLVPGKHPVGPAGQRGVRVWGNGGGIVAFGLHLRSRPEVVLRVLRMLDTMVAEEEWWLISRFGQRGLHWDYRLPDNGTPESGPGSGFVKLPPYDDVNQWFRSMLGYFNPGDSAAFRARYADRQFLEFSETHCHPRWGLPDALGKPDVVPSAARYLGDLRTLQMKVYAEIIRGDRPFEDFDSFCEEWRRRGGDAMTAEANELYRQRRIIYQRVGVPGI
jgi:putative aldouronate transport system substrate-binding protein